MDAIEEFSNPNNRTVVDNALFAYNVTFTYLSELTVAEEDSAMYVCDESVFGTYESLTQLFLLYTDFEAWRHREKLLNNVKPIIFSHVEILELIYPASYACQNLNSEIYTKLETYNDVVTADDSNNLILMNALKNLGTIFHEMLQIDTCFSTWDGECAGERLAKTTFALIDPAIIEDWNTLESDGFF